MSDADESEFVHHEPCPECGSRDNLARYTDGHGYCFGCGHYEKGDGEDETADTKTKRRTVYRDDKFEMWGDALGVKSRKISSDTAEKFNYRVGPHKGRPAHFAYYYSDDRKPIAVKIRYPDKTFEWKGKGGADRLYGQWLWRDTGKMLVITEGELDAMSVSQLQGNRWPVVSIPTGSQGATKAVRKNLDWIEGFERVVFLFDMDEPGREAAKECATLLTPGKAYIGSLPLNDPNDMLVAGRGKEVIDAIWGAKPFRPDGIVFGSDITMEVLQQTVGRGKSIPYPSLDEKLHGLRPGELTLFTGGTGSGKSTVAREIAYHLHQTQDAVIGNIYLEEGYGKTAQGYVAIHNNVSLGLLREDPSRLSPEQWDDSLENVIHDRMYFYDHFGSLEGENLINHMRYMVISLGVEFIVLDHISIVISGQTSSKEGERKDIDKLMTKLRSLIEETGVGIIGVVHLKQPEGKPHEEGGRVTLSQLRGSGSLKQLSDNVVAIERDQQSDGDIAAVRVLKCREFGGAVGLADKLKYHHDTGRLLVATEFELEGANEKPTSSSGDEGEEDSFPY